MSIERAFLRAARPNSWTRQLAWREKSLEFLAWHSSARTHLRPSLKAGNGTTHSSLTSRTPFSTTTALLKKGAKAERAANPTAPADDPADFTTLDADIAEALERLKSDLSKLRAGGRFNHEVIENLRVQPEKSSKQTVKLSDVAQVVPKGRTVQIMVGEKDHLKPVQSAIQSSNLSLTPQADPTGANPLLLVINIPPPTAESRQAVIDEAKKAGLKASAAVKDARAKQHKTIKTMEKNKTARQDDAKKAGEKMEKVVEKGTAEVKKTAEQAKKNLESG